MTDWSKYKVADLKEECKARNIPLTGLKLKQHYIDKLAEHEVNNSSQDAVHEEPSQDDDENTEKGQDQNVQAVNGNGLVQADEPVALQNEDVQGEEREEKLNYDTQDATMRTMEEKKDLPEAQPDETVTQTAHPLDETPGLKDAQVDEIGTSTAVLGPQSPAKTETPDQPQADTPPATTHSTMPSNLSTPGSTQVPLAELAEDQRKRKRRSVTPVPDANEVALKKARANDGTPVVPNRGADTLEQVQRATDAVRALREADGLPKDGSEQAANPLKSVDPVASTLDRPLEAVAPTDSTSNPPTIEREPPREAVTETKKDPSPKRERSTVPALHPVTSSLYIRNFKRPLHIPTLREHIVKLARSQSDSNSEPVKTFYLDSIRTHALISFISPTAASRVRAEMHETRFPDEPQREALFVDYVPDDKVQGWIDQETGGGFGRGGNNRRYDVVYNRVPGGVEAVLQDADTSRHRASLPPPRGSISNAPIGFISSGIHPDRAPLGPREERKLSYRELTPKRDAGEKGFKALDELFSFTTAKPKLYYKPVSPEVVDDRLDMVKGLRVGHAGMGRSGDEGMKRFTFERYKGREEWVDKGPEFGHGQRGQAILRGDRGRGRGGYRGGRGDAWRGR